MQQKLNFFFSNLEKIQKARFSKHRLQVSHLQFLGVYTLQKTFPKMSIPEASTPSLLWRSLRSSKSFSRYSVSSILPTIFLITPRMYMPCLQHRVHLVNLSPLSRFKGRPSVPVDWSAFEHKIKNKAMVCLGNTALHFTITFCLMWIVGTGYLHIFLCVAFVKTKRWMKDQIYHTIGFICAILNTYIPTHDLLCVDKRRIFS